jgi:hypothetical protein
MVVIRKKAATKKSFANMIAVIRLHLMSFVDLMEFIKDTYKAWKNTYGRLKRAGPIKPLPNTCHLITNTCAKLKDGLEKTCLVKPPE